VTGQTGLRVFCSAPLVAARRNDFRAGCQVPNRCKPLWIVNLQGKNLKSAVFIGYPACLVEKPFISWTFSDGG
jgi:hypothetical protein